MPKFQLSSFYPDGLRQIFDFFQEKLKIFSKKIQNFPNQMPKSMPKRQLLPNFEPSSILLKFSKMFEFFEFGTPQNLADVIHFGL
jgi:hypothetical protein